MGMVVTSDEFDRRHDNAAFNSFLEDLKTDPASTDYLNRSNKMTPEERETFFFQEFIREGHPARIKEWITGRHTIIGPSSLWQIGFKGFLT
jgi:hypothetical protein